MLLRYLNNQTKWTQKVTDARLLTATHNQNGCIRSTLTYLFLI